MYSLKAAGRRSILVLFMTFNILIHGMAQTIIRTIPWLGYQAEERGWIVTRGTKSSLSSLQKRRRC